MEITLDLFVPKTPLTQGGGEEIVAEEQVKAMEFAVLKAKGEIVPKAPANTGLLRKSIITRVFMARKEDLLGLVATPMVQGLPLEMGAKWSGRQPPTEPLRLWAQRKFSVDESEARSIAFCVARKLKARGLAALHFFRDGYEAAKPAIEARWAQGLLKIRLRLAKGE